MAIEQPIRHKNAPGRSAWDPCYELQEKNGAIVRSILEGRELGSGDDFRKVTAYCAACMAEATVEKQGLAPLTCCAWKLKWRRCGRRISSARIPRASITS